MPVAQSGQPFESFVSGMPPGLVGTIGYTIYDDNGNVAVARLATGIVEFSPGAYRARGVAPALAPGVLSAVYQVMWDSGGAAPRYGMDELDVIVSSPPPPAGIPLSTSYTTTTEVAAYLANQPGGVPSNWPADGPFQAAVVAAAEKDVDLLAVTVSIDASTGRRLTAVLDQMSPYQIQALKDAVAAQVEYRLVMGGAFFRDPQFAEVRGPAFTTKGKRPIVGPKTKREFALGAFALGLGRSSI